MNVEIGTDAAQFPEEEYINGIYAVFAEQDRIISVTFFIFVFYL
jgi:hypothetical protein